MCCVLRLRSQVLLPFIFSLFKAIVGSGILSLSNSISRWTDNPSLIAPVIALSVSACVLARSQAAPSGLAASPTFPSLQSKMASSRDLTSSASWMHAFISTVRCIVSVPIRKSKLTLS